MGSKSNFLFKILKRGVIQFGRLREGDGFYRFPATLDREGGSSILMLGIQGSTLLTFGTKIAKITAL